MIDVIYKGKTYPVPEHWNELSPEQFIEVVRILLSMPDRSLCDLLLLQVFLQVDTRFINKIPPEILPGALHLTSWVYDDMILESLLLPYIKAPRKLYGPAPAFQNMTALEFHWADMFYNQWKRSGTDEDLLPFVSVLYRPAKKKYNIVEDPDGDKREIFNPNLIEFHSSKIRLKREVVVAILFQYEAWRRGLEKDHRPVFERHAVTTNTPNAGWFGVFRGIASDGKYGTMEKVEQMPIKTLMLELEFLISEANTLKAKYPDLFKA